MQTSDTSTTRYGIYNLTTQQYLTIRFGMNSKPEVRTWKTQLEAQVKAEALTQARPHLNLEVRVLPSQD